MGGEWLRAWPPRIAEHDTLAPGHVAEFDPGPPRHGPPPGARRPDARREQNRAPGCGEGALGYLSHDTWPSRTAGRVPRGPRIADGPERVRRSVRYPRFLSDASYGS